MNSFIAIEIKKIAEIKMENYTRIKNNYGR
jgi:hypothetical protein